MCFEKKKQPGKVKAGAGWVALLQMGCSGRASRRRWYSHDWQEWEAKEGSQAQKPQVEGRVGDTVQGRTARQHAWILF